MEVKKGKVASKEFSKDFKNDYGTFYSFIIKFEGSDESHGYTSKNKDTDKFKVGEEAEYTEEVKTYKKKDGTDASFKVIKPYVENKGFSGKGGYSFNLDNEKLKSKLSTPSYALSYAKDLFASGKITKEDVLNISEEWSNWMRQQIDLV